MSSKLDQEKFEQALKELTEKFLAGETPDDSTEKIGKDLMQYILARQRAHQGVPDIPTDWPTADRKTRNIIRNWDTDNDQFLLTEKAIKRLLRGKFSDAVNIVERKNTRISFEQSQRAKAPRGNGRVAEKIEELISNNPSISHKQLRLELEVWAAATAGIQFDEVEIYDENDNAQPAKWSGLKDRIYRMRIKILGPG